MNNHFFLHDVSQPLKTQFFSFTLCTAVSDKKPNPTVDKGCLGNGPFASPKTTLPAKNPAERPFDFETPPRSPDNETRSLPNYRLLCRI